MVRADLALEYTYDASAVSFKINKEIRMRLWCWNKQKVSPGDDREKTNTRAYYCEYRRT